jgi:6-phosphogluconolactonase (cycloisomerase 2 family)
LEQIPPHAREGLDRSFAGPLAIDTKRHILHASGKGVVASFRMDTETGRLSLLKQERCTDNDEEAVSSDLFVTDHSDIPFVLV